MLKTAKRHFSHSSLAVAAVGATEEMLYNDLNTFGFIFEGLCEQDLKIYAECIGAKMFYLRDDKGNAAEELLKLKSIMEKEGDNPPKVLCGICGMSIWHI